jgi:hypothetical protein
MKRKLIEIHQEDLIICDNPICDFKVKNPTGNPNEDISEYLNKPCPNCGQNLLTNEDYEQSLKLMRTINWANKWFSWLTYIFPNKPTSTILHVHEGLHIKEK